MAAKSHSFVWKKKQIQNQIKMFAFYVSKIPYLSLIFHNFCLTIFSSLLPSPPGMTWPTSCTVRAEFLSSVLTLMTPWLRPPMDRMARAGRGAPGTPGLRRREFDQTWMFPTIPSVLTVRHLPTLPCTPPHMTDYIFIWSAFFNHHDISRDGMMMGRRRKWKVAGTRDLFTVSF